MKIRISFSKKRSYGSLRNIVVGITVKVKGQMSMLNEPSRTPLAKNKRSKQNWT